MPRTIFPEPSKKEEHHSKPQEKPRINVQGGFAQPVPSYCQRGCHAYQPKDQSIWVDLGLCKYYCERSFDCSLWIAYQKLPIESVR